MKYKIGQKVWIKPVDAGDLEGIVTGFQVDEPFYPIVEFEYNGEIKSNAFEFMRINLYEKGKVKPVYVRVI